MQQMIVGMYTIGNQFVQISQMRMQQNADLQKIVLEHHASHKLTGCCDVLPSVPYNSVHVHNKSVMNLSWCGERAQVMPACAQQYRIQPSVQPLLLPVDSIASAKLRQLSGCEGGVAPAQQCKCHDS